MIENFVSFRFHPVEYVVCCVFCHTDVLVVTVAKTHEQVQTLVDDPLRLLVEQDGGKVVTVDVRELHLAHLVLWGKRWWWWWNGCLIHTMRRVYSLSRVSKPSLVSRSRVDVLSFASS